MKKSLLIALAICLLLLAGCGTLAGTNGAVSTPAHHSTPTVTTIPQIVNCGVLHARQVSLSQEIQQVSVQLSAAAARGNQNIVRQAEQALIRLHWLLTQDQAGQNACPTTR